MGFLRVDKISKSYKKKMVVKSVSLEVREGEILGLLGPNGAGKTTTFYMIAGFIAPDTGGVFLDDVNITELAMYQRARLGLGYLPQESTIFKKISVWDNLGIILDTLSISSGEKNSRIEQALSSLGILHLQHQKAMTLSGGERRRLEIARALSLKPKILLLDEPYAGIDPIAVAEIQNILFNLRLEGIGMIISDHNVRETLSSCDEACLIKEGEIWLKGKPEVIVNNPLAKRYYLGEGFKI